MARKCTRYCKAGMKFGRLTALEDGVYYDKILCRCDCGQEKRIPGNGLLSGFSTSCGCKAAESRANMAAYDGVARHHEVMRKYHTDPNKLIVGGKPNANNVSTGVRGVCLYKGRYHTSICFKGHQQTLGNFKTLQEAIDARREAELRLFAPAREEIRRNEGR